MPEYTEIKLVWKYEGNYPSHVKGRDSWMLVMNGTEMVARVLRHSNEFMQRVPGLSRLMLMRNRRHWRLFPWSVLEAGLDKDRLFKLSDSGIMTADIDAVYGPAIAMSMRRRVITAPSEIVNA